MFASIQNSSGAQVALTHAAYNYLKKVGTRILEITFWIRRGAHQSVVSRWLFSLSGERHQEPVPEGERCMARRTDVGTHRQAHHGYVSVSCMRSMKSPVPVDYQTTAHINEMFRGRGFIDACVYLWLDVIYA
jgi:hypothetical protein